MAAKGAPLAIGDGGMHMLATRIDGAGQRGDLEMPLAERAFGPVRMADQRPGQAAGTGNNRNRRDPALALKGAQRIGQIGGRRQAAGEGTETSLRQAKCRGEIGGRGLPLGRIGQDRSCCWRSGAGRMAFYPGSQPRPGMGRTRHIPSLPVPMLTRYDQALNSGNMLRCNRNILRSQVRAALLTHCIAAPGV